MANRTYNHNKIIFKRMKKHIVLFLGLIFSLTIVLTFCKCDCDENEPPALKIKIGALLSITGAGSSTGESTQSALQEGMRDINKYLAEIGSEMEVELLIKDTQTDTLVALERLIELHQDGVSFVIGPYSSASVKAVKAYADDNDILIVSPSSVGTSLAIAGDNIFRLVPNDHNQAKAINAMLLDDGIEFVIPVVRNDLWGNELFQAASLQFSQHGGLYDNPIKYEPAIDNFSQVIEQLSEVVNEVQLDKNRIAIHLISFGEGTEILDLASSENIFHQVNWYGSSAFAENASLPMNQAAAAFAASQAFSCPVFGYDETAKDKWQPLVDRIQADIGRKPEMYALVTYDALWLAISTYLAIDNNTDFNELKQAFIYEADNYFGVTGWITLNDAGDRAYSTYDFWGIKHSLNKYEWQVVATFSNITGQLTRY